MKSDTPKKNEKVAAFLEKFGSYFEANALDGEELAIGGQMVSPAFAFEVSTDFLKDHLPSLLMEIISECLPPEKEKHDAIAGAIDFNQPKGDVDYYDINDCSAQEAEVFNACRRTFLQALKGKI